jgi:parallel beta-helix repeat protein
MSQISFAKLLSIVMLALGVRLASASTITYEVGTCKAHIPTYKSISAALAATPAPNVVQVCPGTYNEQVEITQPVTLEGLSAANSDQVIIAVPGTGLAENGPGGGVQLWVNNVVGAVTITGITVDAAGNGVTNGTRVIGIYYQNSSGTVNRITTRNQRGGSAPTGWGIFIEGGTSNPSVTVENSSIRNADIAIVTGTDSSSSELTAIIKGNNVQPLNDDNTYGIYIEEGATTTVTGNFVSGAGAGIVTLEGSAGSVSGNTLIGNVIGVSSEGDGVPITSNKILNSTARGLDIDSVAAIHGNIITNSPIGIEFDCIANGNVHANVINDAAQALSGVPLGVTTTNSYFNVGAVRTTGGC